MGEERRQREKEAMKELILKVASEIIKEDGLNKLSIRNIAQRIDYSPSIIYHYFKDKDEILDHVMQNGYQKILQAVASVTIEASSPKDRLKSMTENYIRAAISMPTEFLAVQLSDSSEVLKYTSSLFRGASKSKPALNALYNCLKDGHQESTDQDLELKAQMVAVATLGLIIKLTVEKDLDDQQKNILIDYFSNEVVQNIAFSK